MNKINVIIKSIVLLGIIYMLGVTIDAPLLLSSLKKASAGWLLLALLSTFFSYLAGTLRWKVLLPNVRIKHLLISYFISRFFYMVLPGQIFGEISKVGNVLHYNKNINASHVVSSVLADKIFGLMGLLLLSCLGLLNSPHTANLLPLKISTILFLLIFILTIYFSRKDFFISTVVKVIVYCENKFTCTSKICSFIKKVFSTWTEYCQDKKVLFSMFGFSLLYQIFISIFCVCISCSIGISVSFWDWSWIMGIISILLLLPISFGGLGLREASLVSFLHILGIPMEAALACSLLMLFYHLLCALVGAVLLLFQKYSPIKRNSI